MRRKIIIISFSGAFLCLLIASLIILYQYLLNPNFISPLSKTPYKEKPLEKYSYSRLKQSERIGSDIVFGNIVKENPGFISQIFYFSTEGKKASGLINYPAEKGVYPIILMIRGFVDQTIYSPGMGTQRAGEIYAQNGFVTLAPDFLGYGDSASPSASSIEERFETYTTVLDLLASLPNLNNIDKKIVQVDFGKVGIWGHSNGGQIALSVLEITGKDYPTVLWAPVSKPFPYSILYFTDEFEDHGKALRKVVADFERDYDIEKYSPYNYYSWIDAPIQLHQGGQDEAVPQKWSDNLYADLKKLDKNITYYTYTDSDHNLLPGGWNLAIQRSLDFYRKYLLLH